MKRKLFFHFAAMLVTGALLSGVASATSTATAGGGTTQPAATCVPLVYGNICI